MKIEEGNNRVPSVGCLLVRGQEPRGKSMQGEMLKIKNEKKVGVTKVAGGLKGTQSVLLCGCSRSGRG